MRTDTIKTLWKLNTLKDKGYEFKLKPESLSKTELKEVINAILDIKVHSIDKTISIVKDQIYNGGTHLSGYHRELINLEFDLTEFTDRVPFRKDRLVRLYRGLQKFCSNEIEETIKWYNY